VYTSGVDQKISQFCFVKTSPGEKSSSRRWIQTSSRRMHSHDVRALAIWPPYTTLPPSHRHQFPIDIAPILASGGLDMSVVVTPAALPTNTVVKIVNTISTSIHSTFEDSYHRRLAYSSGPSSTSAVQIARQARLVCCARDAGLGIWRIIKKPAPPEEEPVTADDPDAAGWEKVLDMELNVHTNLLATAISDNGRWLIVSDLYESKLFALSSGVSGSEVQFHQTNYFFDYTGRWCSETETHQRILCYSAGASATEKHLNRWPCISLQSRFLKTRHFDSHWVVYSNCRSRRWRRKTSSFKEI
jgi:U3 small nucleolar RNA-associated protein 4